MAWDLKGPIAHLLAVGFGTSHLPYPQSAHLENEVVKPGDDLLSFPVAFPFSGCPPWKPVIWNGDTGAWDRDGRGQCSAVLSLASDMTPETPTSRQVNPSLF